jgi:predicted GNAT family acetyltransferase
MLMEPVTVMNNEKQMQFQAKLEGEIAFLEYRMHDGTLVLMHTEVPEKLGGRGVGTALAEFAFQYARERHLPVKVYCPFVQAYLKRHPENMDMVVKQESPGS